MLELRHGLRLLRPRIPTILLGSAQASLNPTPPQMVSGEQETALVEQHTMATGVPGGWDDHKLGRQFHGLGAIEHELGMGLRRQLGPMDDPLAPELLSILMRLGDVIAMRQEDVADAAEFLEPLDQM